MESESPVRIVNLCATCVPSSRACEPNCPLLEDTFPKHNGLLDMLNNLLRKTSARRQATTSARALRISDREAIPHVLQHQHDLPGRTGTCPDKSGAWAKTGLPARDDGLFESWRCFCICLAWPATSFAAFCRSDILTKTRST